MNCNVEKRKEFVEVCDFITKNYFDLKNELEDVLNLLKLAGGFGAAYIERNMTEFHFKVAAKESIHVNLSLLSSKIAQLGNEAKEEFFQKVNISNMYDEILAQIRKNNILKYVFETRKILNYILYSINRIYLTKEMDKKIVILKGMIVYY